MKTRVSDDPHDLLVNVDPYPAKYKTMIRTTSHRDAVIYARIVDAWWRTLDDD